MAKKQNVATATDAEVFELVREYLRPHQPRDYQLEVIEEGSRKDDDWWYVLVRPNREDVRPYDYYSRLAEAEVTLRDEKGLNVLLVPVLPE